MRIAVSLIVPPVCALFDCNTKLYNKYQQLVKRHGGCFSWVRLPESNENKAFDILQIEEARPFYFSDLSRFPQISP